MIVRENVTNMLGGPDLVASQVLREWNGNPMPNGRCVRALFSSAGLQRRLEKAGL